MQSTWFCERDVWIPWQREELRLTSLETAGGARITAEARAGGGRGKGEDWPLAPVKFRPWGGCFILGPRRLPPRFLAAWPWSLPTVPHRLYCPHHHLPKGLI